MPKANLTFLTTAVVSAMILVGTASATPGPDRGPTVGGTTVMVPEPAGVTFREVFAGGTFNLALGDNGNTYAWGFNDSGQLGDNSQVYQRVPVRVILPEAVTFTSIAAGGRHALALGDNGKAYSWGDNWYRQLGLADYEGAILIETAQEVSLPTDVSLVRIAAGFDHSLGLEENGQVYAWGHNYYGQLGDGSTKDRPFPVSVSIPNGQAVTDISGGLRHSLALGADGRVWAWGYNEYGQLGDGSGMNQTEPVEVALPEDVSIDRISAAAGHFSLALSDDGRIWAWGLNDSGQLGVGSTITQRVPVEVVAPEGVAFTDISAGYDFSLALSDDGRVWAWGNNGLGQLGDGSGTDQFYPVEVAVPEGVSFSAIYAGLYHALALADIGRAYSWGLNERGLLGDGSGVNQSTPVPVAAEVLVTSIAFDGVAGQAPMDPNSTAPANNGDGTWSVVTPAHAAGPVDVEVSWTFNGVEQPPVIHPDGFTYYPVFVPTVTDPESHTVLVGEAAEFTVSVTGEPAPAVTWEGSADRGGSWHPVTGGISEDGLSVTIGSVGLADSGTWYRAIATNSQGVATSSPAELTVTEPVASEDEEGEDGTGENGATDSPFPGLTDPLAETGLDGSSLLWAVGWASIALAGGLFAAVRARRG